MSRLIDANNPDVVDALAMELVHGGRWQWTIIEEDHRERCRKHARRILTTQRNITRLAEQAASR